MKDVVYLSTKKKKSVPSVAAQKPNEPEPQPAIPEAPAEKQDVPIQTVPEESPSVSAPLKSILASLTPDKLEMAKMAGLEKPLKCMTEWMVQREAFEQQVVKGFEDLGKKLEPAMKLTAMIEKAQQQQTQTPASSGNVGAGIGSLLQLLPSILGAGGGGSSAMQDKILDMAIESMGLGNALVRAIIVKTAPEMATSLLKPYEKKEGT